MTISTCVRKNELSLYSRLWFVPRFILPGTGRPERQRKAGETSVSSSVHIVLTLRFLGAVVLCMLILLCKNRENNQIIGNSCTTTALLPAFPFSAAVPKIPRVNSVKIHIFSSVTFTLFLCYFTEKSKQTDV